MKRETMKKMNLLLSAMIVSLPLASYGQGGDKVGGGGDLLKCTDDGVTKYWLLDVRDGFEKGETLALGDDSLSIYEKIELVRAAYVQMDELRADAYADEAIKIAQDLEAIDAGKPAPNGIAIYLDQIAPGTILADHEDENEIFAYQKCEIENGKNKKYQLVRQGYYGKNNPYYIFDRERWKLLKGDKDQQVATFYHEAILRDHRARGQQYSSTTREMNRKLINGQIKAMSTKSYLEFLAENQLGQLAYHPQVAISLLDDEVLFDEQGEVVSAKRKNGTSYSYIVREGIESPVQAPNSMIKYHLNELKFAQRQFVKGVIHDILRIKENAEKKKEVQIRFSNRKHYDESYMWGSYEDLLRNGELQPLADGTFILSGLEKSYDVGRLNLRINKDGIVLSQDETGSWGGEMSIGAYSEAAELMSCARAVIDEGKGGFTGVERVGQWLNSVRTLLYSQDVPAITQLTDQCQGFYAGSARVKLSKKKREKFIHKTYPDSMGTRLSREQRTVKDLLLSLVRPQAVLCEDGFDLSASAGAMFVFSTGLRKMTCTLSNGKRMVYAGVKIGVGLGLGAAIHASKFDPDAGGVISVGDSGLHSNEYYGQAVLGVVGLNIDRYSDVTHSKLLHLGLEARVTVTEGGFMLRVSRKKDDFSWMIYRLARTNVAPVPQVKP